MELQEGDFSTISVVDDFAVSFNGQEYQSPNLGDYIVGKKFGVWLVEDDVYLTLTFNSWGKTNAGGSFSYTRTTEPPVSTYEPETDNQVRVSPNPSSDFIQFSGLNGTENFRIFDVLGTEILRGVARNNEKIDVSNCTSGLYFVRLENSTKSTKFIRL